MENKMWCVVYSAPMRTVPLTGAQIMALPMYAKVEKLNVLSEILGFELVDKAGENYILISKEEDLIAKINFVNKFGDKTDLQINVKKILDGEL